MLVEETTATIPVPFLVVVVCWLTLIFASFGLFAPANGTATAALVICALSVAGSVFLITELNTPFSGLMKVSGAPLRYALSQLGH
jgi:membrane-bound ClpP family serine protease